MGMAGPAFVVRLFTFTPFQHPDDVCRLMRHELSYRSKHMQQTSRQLIFLLSFLFSDDSSGTLTEAATCKCE